MFKVAVTSTSTLRYHGKQSLTVFFFLLNMHYSYKNEIINWTIIIMKHLIQDKFLCALS